MRSKKITQLKNTSVNRIKTKVKRHTTNKTKKRGRMFTQKAGAGVGSGKTESKKVNSATNVEDYNNRIKLAEVTETTVDRALREQKELEENIRKDIEEKGYNIEEIKTALSKAKHKAGYYFSKNKYYNYNEIITYGKAYKNKALKELAIRLVAQKNQKLEDDAVDTMSIKLLNYVHNQYIEEGKDRYGLLSEGLERDELQKALENDEELLETFVDRMNKELEERMESGKASKSKKYEFFKLASCVFKRDRLPIPPEKTKEFKELFKGDLKENKFVLFFQKLNKDAGRPLTTEEIEKKVALMFKLYTARTTVGKYAKIRTPWFTPLSVRAEQFDKYTRRKGDALKRSVIKAGKEFFEDGYEECSLIKELNGNEQSLSLDESFTGKIIRQMIEGDFFKKEDEYFLGLLKKNTKRFCFQNKEATDEFEYSRFCKRINKCLKTPNLLHELLFDAIDAKATTRMYEQLPGFAKESLRARIQEQYADEFKERLGDSYDDKEFLALVLTFVQDENIRSLAKYLKEVIIQTFLDYKESSSKAPRGSYTGNIVVEPYFDDIFKLLKEKTNKEEDEEDSEGDEEATEDNENNQAGGASKVSYKTIKDKMVKSGYKPIYNAAQLKQISEEELYQGLKNCDKKDLIKSDYEKRTQEGTDELGNEFDQEDEGIDSIGQGMETPKLLYILMGSLIVVGIIESGFLDAPPCMTHTII